MPDLVKLLDGPAGASLDASPPHIGIMKLQLLGEQAATLEEELRNTVENDRCPFSPHIPDVARDSQHNPTGAETRTAP